MIDSTASPASIDTAVQRRRWVLPVAIAGVVAIGAVGIVASRRGNNDPATASNASTQSGGGDESAASAAATANPPLRMIIDDVPEGYVLQWMQDPADARPEDMPAMMGARVVLLAKPEANFATGGWIAVTTRLMDRFERPRFDPASDGNMQAPRTFSLGEMKAAAGTTWDGFESLAFGPVNEAFAVTIAGVDVAQATLTEVAGLIEVDDDGRATLRDSAVLAGYAPIGVFENLWGLGGLAEGNPTATMSVNYGSPNGSSWISVSNAATSLDDPLALARFMTKNPVDSTVHGQPAVAGDVATVQPQPGQPARVTWVEDGRLVTVNANLAADELLALAETTRVATQAEWDALREEWQQRQEEMNEGNQSNPTWIIEAGDLEDASTWVAEGGFVEETGGWVSSVSLMTSDGSSMAGGGWGGGTEVELPHLELLPQQFGGMNGMSNGATVVIGLVAVDAADGAVLRFTPTDAGEPQEVALRLVRDDWPAWAAALALPAESVGALELVAADGTVLASNDVEALELVEGQGQIAVAPRMAAAAEVAAG